MNPTNNPFASFASSPLLAVVCLLVLCCLHGFDFHRSIILTGEVSALFLLLYAWYLQWGTLRIPVLYVLSALFFYRLIYFLSDPLSTSWYMRSNAVLNPYLYGWLYFIGVFALHPQVYFRLRSLAQKIAAYTVLQKRVILSAWFVLAAVCFFFFQSVHITRDGFDWIQRTTEPVWYLYLREPLTIAIYRFVYVTANLFFTLSSKNAIVLVSICFSLIGLYAYHQFLKSAFYDPFERLLGWLLLCSFGGLSVLFFGHVEVYPVFAGCLLVTFLCLQKYGSSQWNVVPLALVFSVTFTVHLSAGWLIPALFLTPVMTQQKNMIKDTLILLVLFCVIQLCFWGGLIVWKYDANVSTFIARLHQTFTVGLDRSMFIPPSGWFTPYHIEDWLSVYLYLMPSALLLFPLAIMNAVKPVSRNKGLWFGFFIGYFIYTFCWNADRGYPEDWDLFSPITAITLPLLLHLFLNRNTDTSQSEPDPLLVSLYISSVGFIPFSLAQIWFHHTQRFITF